MGSMPQGQAAPGGAGGAPRISGTGTQMGGINGSMGGSATRPGFTPGGTVGMRSMPTVGGQPTPSSMPGLSGSMGGAGIGAGQYERMQSGSPRISGPPVVGGDGRPVPNGLPKSPPFVGSPVERPPYIQEPPLPPYKPPGGPDKGGPGGPIQPGTGPNVYSQASNWLDQSADATRQAMAYRPQNLSSVNLDPYMNPFTQSVIDTTMADMNRGRQMAINDNGAAATRAGAFGGSRHGLVEAETNRGFADTAGRMSADLWRQNFGQAQGAAQGDLARADAQNAMRMQGAGQLAGLSGQAFGYGQAIDDNLLQQGMLQRDMQQQIIDAGKQQWQGYTGAADQGLSRLLAMLGGQQYPTSQTNSKKPGFADWIGLLA